MRMVVLIFYAVERMWWLSACKSMSSLKIESESESESCCYVWVRK
jgi:hypothetical protein